MQEQNRASQPEDHVMAAVLSRSTNVRKMASPKRESTGHGTVSQCPLLA
jgi:hypothetical protein